jgi:predicted RNA-binding protein with PIN domain
VAPIKLLIDGYNVIPAIPELGRTLRRDLTEGREAFLALLGEYRRASPASPDITVIFDGKHHTSQGRAGRGRVGQERSGRVHGIGVRFSRNEIADDLILRMLEKEMRGATLVSSDRALGEAARALGATVVRSGEFTGRLLMTMAGGEPEEESEDRPGRTSTKKKGNPRKLPKKERGRRRSLGNL